MTRILKDDVPPTFNAFCPTGQGGGIDPSCSPDGGGGGGNEATFMLSKRAGKIIKRKEKASTDVEVKSVHDLAKNSGFKISSGSLQLREYNKLPNTSGKTLTMYHQNGDIITISKNGTWIHATKGVHGVGSTSGMGKNELARHLLSSHLEK